MVKAFRVLIAAVASVSAFAVMVAAPAQADEATYLQRLLPRYAYLNPQQLLAEGYRVCDAERSGITSSVKPLSSSSLRKCNLPIETASCPASSSR